MEDLLRDFLRHTLAMWHVRGTVEPGEGSVVAMIVLQDGSQMWVERLSDGAPFRWSVRCGHAGASEASPRERRPRRCASISGVLNAMRLTLNIDRGTPVRVAAPVTERSPNAAAEHPYETLVRNDRPETKAPAAQSPDGPTPVSVITGFLGSGKTTLLGRLLRHPSMSGTAVIINEFGEVGLDHDLVETSTETFVTISNGCLCCKVRSDLTATLMDLAARRAVGTVPPFDRVVIETSGLADPAPILHALMSDADLLAIYELDTVVTTVDAVTGLSTLARHTESVNQAALADRIVLTKTDVRGAQTDAILARIARINPRVSVLRAIRGEVEPVALFARKAGVSPSHRALLDALESRDVRVAHQHRDEITSASLVRDDPISAVTLALFLSALGENCGADLLRMKGIVAVAEQPDRPAVVHGVQHVYHAPVWLDGWPSNDRRTRMVFIARNFSPQWACALLELLEQEVHQVSSRAPIIGT
jgi:G3E family GTPase